MNDPANREAADPWQELAQITNTMAGDGGFPAIRQALESAAAAFADAPGEPTSEADYPAYTTAEFILALLRELPGEVVQLRPKPEPNEPPPAA